MRFLSTSKSLIETRKGRDGQHFTQRYADRMKENTLVQIDTFGLLVHKSVSDLICLFHWNKEEDKSNEHY